MLEYDRIDVFQSIDNNKTDNPYEFVVRHYYFL